MNQSDENKPSLEDLQKKIGTIKASKQQDAGAPAQASKVGKAMHIATELLAAIGVGGGLGYWIDSYFGTFPIFFIMLFFLGFAAGMKIIINYSKNN